VFLFNSFLFVSIEFGQAITWGRNSYGQLGDRRPETWKPKAIPTNLRFIQLAIGSQHTIGLTKDLQLFSWGWNEHGSCGDGTLQDKFHPQPVILPKHFVPHLIGSGAAHSFAAGNMQTQVRFFYNLHVIPTLV